MNCEHMMDLSLHDNGEDFDVRIYNVPDERLIGVFTNYYDTNDILPKSYYCVLLDAGGSLALRSVLDYDILIAPSDDLTECRKSLSMGSFFFIVKTRCDVERLLHNIVLSY